MNTASQRGPGQLPWGDLLVWGGFLLAIYLLQDLFLIIFLTFLLSYLVRAIVVRATDRLIQRGRVVGERWLTFGAFAGVLILFWTVASLIGPMLVHQGRILIAGVERLQPEQILDHALGSTVGAYLFDREYGEPGDARFQAGLKEFEAGGGFGEGAFTRFDQLQSRVQAGFELAYEKAERQRIDNEVLQGGAASQRFDDWFLAVKAPAIVAEHRDAYLARWRAAQPTGTRAGSDGNAQDKDQALARLALADARDDAAKLDALIAEWEKSLAPEERKRIEGSPDFLQTFCDWYTKERARDATIPYDCETYLSLRDAYPDGLAAFGEVYRSHVAESKDAPMLLRSDFRRAMEMKLARDWWASSPAAASLRAHLENDLAELTSALSERIVGFVKGLIAIPVQLVTALLLTILITFDMPRLREGAQSLRRTRLGGVYDTVVPKLAGVVRLIGRAFAAQGVVALFNTVLTLLVMRVLGLQNELILASIVFVASFIPVLGVILSGIPITLQALLQPDGSLALAFDVIVSIAIIHAIEAMVLSPRIVGKLLHLHPVLVFIVLIIGERLFGVWGLLLGVPVAVFIIRTVLLQEEISGLDAPDTAGPGGRSPGMPSEGTVPPSGAGA